MPPSVPGKPKLSRVQNNPSSNTCAVEWREVNLADSYRVKMVPGDELVTPHPRIRLARLEPETEYTLQVCACTGEDCSAYSEKLEFTTRPARSPDAVYAAMAGEEIEVHASCSNCVDARCYLGDKPPGDNANFYSLLTKLSGSVKDDRTLSSRFRLRPGENYVSLYGESDHEDGAVDFTFSVLDSWSFRVVWQGIFDHNFVFLVSVPEHE